jgi:hypothetical protein
LKMYIFKNPEVKRGRDDNGLLCENFFGREIPVLEFEKIAKITMGDLLVRGNLKSLDAISDELGVNFSLATYLRLSEAIAFFKMKKANAPITVPIGAQNFMLSFEKGSQKFRRTLMEAKSVNYNLLNIPSVVTYRNLIGIPEMDSSQVKNLLGFWNFAVSPNTMREFIYKFLYNQLGLNTRVSHFVNNHPRGCTFCTLTNEHPLADESFLHLFFSCPTVTNIRNKILSRYFQNINNGTEMEKKSFLFGCIDGGKNNLFVNFAVFSLHYLIWQMKLRKEIIQFSIFELNWLSMLDAAHKQSSKIRESLLLVNYDIRRRWHG